LQKSQKLLGRNAREGTWRRIFCFSDRRRKSRAKSVRFAIRAIRWNHARLRTPRRVTRVRPLMGARNAWVPRACLFPPPSSFSHTYSLTISLSSFSRTHKGLSDVALAVSLQIGEPSTSSVYFESQIVARGRLSWTVGRSRTLRVAGPRNRDPRAAGISVKRETGGSGHANSCIRIHAHTYVCTHVLCVFFKTSLCA